MPIAQVHVFHGKIQARMGARRVDVKIPDDQINIVPPVRADL